MSDRSNPGSGSEGEDLEEAYEVEEIRDKQRGDDGEYLYYVKWVGWESDTNTWEPVAHLADCPNKLQEFERGGYLMDGWNVAESAHACRFSSS